MNFAGDKEDSPVGDVKCVGRENKGHDDSAYNLVCQNLTGLKGSTEG